MVSRHRKPDFIVLVKTFMCLHEVKNPHLEVGKNADLHCTEEVGLWVVAHDTGSQSKHLEYSGNLAS